MMVVDGRAEIAAPDIELVQLLRKTGRPLFLAVNKADSEKQSHIVDEFHRLGIKQMFPISAEHGRGIDDLLDAIFEVLPSSRKTYHKGQQKIHRIPEEHRATRSSRR